MPRIPATQIGGGSNARGALVDPTVGIPRPTGAGDLADAVQAFQERAEEDERNRDSLRSVEVQETYKRRAAEAEAELNPLEEGYGNKLRTRLEEIRGELMEDPGITNEAILNDLELRLTAGVEGNVTVALNNRRTAIEDEALRVRGELENLTFEQIRDDPDGFEAYLEQFSDQARRLNPGISPEKLEGLNADFGDGALEARIEGLAEAGRTEEAKALLEEDGGELSPEKRRNAGRRIIEIRNRRLADAKAALSTRIADMSVRVIDATSGKELEALRREVDGMEAEGLFAGSLQGTRVALIRSISAKQASLAKSGRDLAEALDKRDRGVLSEKKDVDLAYEHEKKQIRGEDGGQPSAKQVLDHLGEFAASTGRMPSEQKAFIQNAESGDDAQQLAAAAQMDQRLHDRAPHVDSGAGDRVDLTRALVNLTGMDWTSAAQRVVDQVPDRATIAQREEEFRDTVFADFDAEQFVRSDVLGRGIIERALPGAPDVPAKTQRVAERTFRAFYRLNGDEDVAREATANAMARKYGQTRVGRSDPAVVKHPPERLYFPAEYGARLPEDAKDRVLASDVEGTMAELGIEIPDAPDDVPRYILVADYQTEEAMAAGERPSWEVRVRDSFGTLVPVRVETPNGEIKLRTVAPTVDELREIPAYQEYIEEEAGNARTKQRIARSLEAAVDDAEASAVPDAVLGELGGDRGFALILQRGRHPEPPEEGPTFFGQEIPGAKFGGQRFGASAKKRSGPKSSKSSIKAVPVEPIPEAEVEEPDEFTSRARRKKMRGPIPFEPREGEIPRGVRNNNPLNMERTAIKWEGMATDQSADDRFIVFANPKWGIRAGARGLTNKSKLHGLNTVREIIGDEKAGWTPASDNTKKITNDYIAFVAKRMGVDPDQPVNLQDDELLQRMIEAMIHVEIGSQPYASSLIAEAIDMARD